MRDAKNQSLLPFDYFGKDGSFTYEAVVKFDVLPSEADRAAMTLLSMDGNTGTRIFSVRLERQGTMSFIPLPDGGSRGGATAKIPTKGPHAINTSDWFHIAVTYNGIDNLTNSLNVYWTRLDSGVSEAHRIGSGTLTDDFNGRVGVFAIGKEADQAQIKGAEIEPFPGCIDEVRISSIARHPRDFLFVPPDERISYTQSPNGSHPVAGSNELPLLLASIFVDGVAPVLPGQANQALELEPGLHRLDIDFSFPSENSIDPIQLRCQLEGIDESWRQSTRGMSMVCQVRDGNKQIISEAKFDAVGTSKGWRVGPEESELTARAEPLYIPLDGRFIYIGITSGSPDTTGTLVVDNLSIDLPEAGSVPLWQNGDFSRGTNLESPRGKPARWNRLGSDLETAQLSGVGPSVALTIVDSDQSNFGEWGCLQPFDPIIYGGRTVIISWQEAYNVIGGGLHRASYVNVPPGKYNFRAIGLTTGDSPTTASLSLPIVIRLPFWQRSWFPPMVVGVGASVLALYFFIRNARRRSRRRLRELAFQNALERDRTRIARDMHDDLGTRITVLNLLASLALRELDRNPGNSRKHLGQLNQSARGLVVAMDDLVWAVDPAHDSLDQLASHITRLAEEIFRDSPIRCRLDISSLLPARELGADFRHQLSLSVKKSLHNVLRHAGPCEVHLSLRYDGTRIVIEVRDNGVGFESQSGSSRHGLDDLSKRLEEIGGSCTITSFRDDGTRVVFDCLLPRDTNSSKS